MSTIIEAAANVQAREHAAVALRAKAALVSHARSLADMNAQRAEVCTRDQQSLAELFRLNAQAFRNLANLVEGAKS